MKKIDTMIVEFIKTFLCGLLCAAVVTPVAIVILLLTRSNIGLTIFSLVVLYVAGLIWREEYWPEIQEWLRNRRKAKSGKHC